MRFANDLQLKWLEAKNPALASADYCITNLCVLVAYNFSGQATGLTAFEPRDLNDGFASRYQKRRKRNEFSNSKFKLYVPKFLSHRVEGLAAQLEGAEVIYSSIVRIKNLGSFFEVNSRVRVMNIDDSPVLLKFLKHEIEATGFCEIVGQVSDPTKAVEEILRIRPDVLTLDIQMPRMTGVEVLKKLLAIEFFPVIMVSSLSKEESSLVFDALNSGAFDYLQKPKLDEKETFAGELVQKFTYAIEGKKGFAPPKPKKRLVYESTMPENLLWCLGASTGGTQALTQVFTSLPDKIPPTLVVQHIPPVFSQSFAESLNQLCPFRVKEAENGEDVLANHVYVAPGGLQMGIEQNGLKLKIVLRDVPPVNRFKPSVDYMFSEVAKLKGFAIVAGIFTGMGKDGGLGLLKLKNIGAQTFAQDEASSAVYGMPRFAVEVGATNVIVPLEKAAQTLLSQSAKFKAGKAA